MDKLKPCPYCGCVAAQVYSAIAETYVYGCLTFGCVGNIHNQFCKYSSDKEAIEAWNRRVGNDKID